MKRFAALLIFLIISACAPSQQAIQTAIIQTQSAWTAVPSQTPYPTQTAYPTYTSIPSPTRTLLPTFTPLPTSTPTSISPVTLTAISKSATALQVMYEVTFTAEVIGTLRATRNDGYYLVGSEIAPGNWRSTGTSDNCYWELDDENGNIIANDFGMAGGVIHIPSDAYQLQVKDCGDIVFLK
jgi:hypothetical protein